MKELIQRLRKRAALERAAADDWAWCVVRAGCRMCGGEAARAAHHANLALDLEQAADALERQRQVLAHAQEWLDEQGCDCGVDEPGTCAACEVRELLEARHA